MVEGVDGARRGEVWWGDLLRATSSLGANTMKEWATIADVLGLRISVEHAVPDTSGAATISDVGRDAFNHQIEPEVLPVANPIPPQYSDQFEDTQSDTQAVVGAQDFLNSVVEGRGVDLPMLFDGRQTRAALADLLKKNVPSDRLAVDWLTSKIAAGKPVGRVRYEHEWRSAGRTVVIADVSEAIWPFLGDVKRFVSDLSVLVPESQLDLLWADQEEIATPRELLFVASHGLGSLTRIVVISTFGATRGSLLSLMHRRSWALFSVLASQARIDVTAIVFHRLRRWPFDEHAAVRRVYFEDLPNFDWRLNG